ncbi:hypothetical protein GCM10011371_20690 [Novosphingobium marinum]|uniref:Uncharacterized protein YdcH (DUF465 family) n=1 Tax=Novosphingobium marinum TaxID=1514948 RepID=A0A7Y9Y041_9SPHN|nr:DUF465 domain-containing protein [Novosphingobium marinum]NYH96181.1 uncharacterized protein YdcH (DUF465 family) [Novosphingobium marinum]GGC33144.1 hypothetical protein GCM10011371_20690 [Novosphingobium marinum]
MSFRFYRLLERLQRLDDALRLAESRPQSDPALLAGLRHRKLSLRRALARLSKPLAAA